MFMFRISNKLCSNINRSFVTTSTIKRKNNFNVNELKFKSKIPNVPYCLPNIKQHQHNSINIDEQTIQLLERLSMVDIGNKEGFKVLQDSIIFVEDVINNIDVTNTEPLYTVFDYAVLELREDEVTDGNIKLHILKNAKITEEDYFVAPPGNIPLEIEEKNFAE